VTVEAPPTVNGSQLSGAGSAGEERPLGAYGVLSGGFGAALAASLIVLGRSGRLPERIDTRDMVLAGVATHKLSRVITKDKVTTFLRAPFTRRRIASRPGDAAEETPRGTGMQRALGELLSCPYCLSQWLAAGFTVGLLTAPRTTRVIAGIYVAETISDFLQVAYRAADQQA
jgi:Protein of unknown function (DUF1360)